MTTPELRAETRESLRRWIALLKGHNKTLESSLTILDEYEVLLAEHLKLLANLEVWQPNFELNAREQKEADHE